eukprot:534594_1
MDVFAGHNMDNPEQNQDTSKYDKLQNIWICDQCKHENNRILAMKNEFKCAKCQAYLNIMEEKKYHSKVNMDNIVGKKTDKKIRTFNEND